MSAADPVRLAQERREECRREVRRFLAERAAVAHHPATIRRALNAGHQADWTDDEVETAAIFLLNLTPPQVIARHDHLGATAYYQATSAGVLAHERGE